MGLNYIALAGEVISSPEKKHTPDGQPVTSFNIILSVSEEDDSKSGVVKISATKKLSDKAMLNVNIGDTVFVEGKLYTKTIENRFSQKQKIPYIQATNFEIIKSKFIDSSPEINSNQNYSLKPQTNITDDDEIPF